MTIQQANPVKCYTLKRWTADNQDTYCGVALLKAETCYLIVVTPPESKLYYARAFDTPHEAYDLYQRINGYNPAILDHNDFWEMTR